MKLELQYGYICSTSILLCTTRITDKSTRCVNFVKAGCLKWRGNFCSGPENATVAVVGKCAPNKEPGKPFCLPKALRPEQDKLQGVDNIVYHAWISKCVTEGRIVNSAEYKVPLVSHTTKVQFNLGTSALFHVLVN